MPFTSTASMLNGALSAKVLSFELYLFWNNAPLLAIKSQHVGERLGSLLEVAERPTQEGAGLKEGVFGPALNLTISRVKLRRVISISYKN